MQDIMWVFNTIQDKVLTLSAQKLNLRTLVANNCVKTLVMMPEGSLVTIDNRQNPSGGDGTTEKNCMAHMLIETFMQLQYADLILSTPNINEILAVKRGTKYLGDDRIACSRGFLKGYMDYYRDNVTQVGVKVKKTIRTFGPVGAEFAGFTIQKSFWDEHFYVPFYNVDKLYVGMFIEPTLDLNILMSRFMAYGILLFPQQVLWKSLQPYVLSFISKYSTNELYDPTVIFWTDTQYLIRLWSGLESLPSLVVEGGIFDFDVFRPDNSDESP
jgi:hypothetical protein